MYVLMKVDHFYDKLIGISVFPIRNSYLDEESEKRRQPLIEFLLYFGTHNALNESALE